MTDLTHVTKELNATIGKLTALAKNMPTEVKTMNRHDFTGYGEDALIQTLTILDAQVPLPGPLRVVQQAVSAAFKAKTGKDWSGAAPVIPSPAMTNKGDILRAIGSKNRGPL